MSRPRIAVYGTTDLTKELQSFVTALTRKLLKDPGVVLVSGGFKALLEFDLRLMFAVNGVSRIPTEGKNLVVVAVVDQVLHFRIFDGDGKTVVDTDEKRLTERVLPIEALRNQLSSLWPPHELTGSEKGRIVTAVTSIVGYTRPGKVPHKGISVDLCVRDAAHEEVPDEEKFKRRFETWLPDPHKERNDVERFEAGTVRRLEGWSHQARRFRVVMGVDALVTISGQGNTRTVLELAYAVDKPALPLGFTGQDSEWFWKEYTSEIVERFHLTDDLVHRLGPGAQCGSEEEMHQLASDVASVVINAAQQWRCLVLMPYGGSHDHFYDRYIAPAVCGVGFHPHRIDRDDHVGRIFELFTSHLEDSRAVILDATGLNFNVMYELGYANAVGIRPLIIIRDPDDEVAIRKLPFYLSEIKLVAVMAAGEELKLKERIQSFLKELAPLSGPIGDGEAV